MIRISKFLILWLSVLLILAACSPGNPELPAESMEESEDNKEAVMETAVSTSTSPANTPTAQPEESFKADLPNLGAAPEIENEDWLNTEEPVTLASQRGKVVLLEFWTFG